MDELFGGVLRRNAPEQPGTSQVLRHRGGGQHQQGHSPHRRHHRRPCQREHCAGEPDPGHAVARALAAREGAGGGGDGAAAAAANGGDQRPHEGGVQGGAEGAGEDDDGGAQGGGGEAAGGGGGAGDGDGGGGEGEAGEGSRGVHRGGHRQQQREQADAEDPRAGRGGLVLPVQRGQGELEGGDVRAGGEGEGEQDVLCEDVDQRGGCGVRRQGRRLSDAGAGTVEGHEQRCRCV